MPFVLLGVTSPLWIALGVLVWPPITMGRAFGLRFGASAGWIAFGLTVAAGFATYRAVSGGGYVALIGGWVLVPLLASRLVDRSRARRDRSLLDRARPAAPARQASRPNFEMRARQRGNLIADRLASSAGASAGRLATRYRDRAHRAKK